MKTWCYRTKLPPFPCKSMRKKQKGSLGHNDDFLGQKSCRLIMKFSETKFNLLKFKMSQHK